MNILYFIRHRILINTYTFYVKHRDRTIITVFATLLVTSSYAQQQQQQQNIVINNNWTVMRNEMSKRPHIIFESSFQTTEGNDYATPLLGSEDFMLWIGENRMDFTLEGRIINKLDIKNDHPEGTLIFKFPRNLNACAKILFSNGWRYHYSLGGCRMTVLIERMWLDRSMIPRCKGFVFVTGHPHMIQNDKTAEQLDNNDLELLEKLAELREKGILTEEEFNQKKTQILFP